ncbi:hypothetical protein GCM10027341_33170 [Spirosoma knui]
MINNNRVRKLHALKRLLEGDNRAARAFLPKLILDLDQFTADELDTLRRYQESCSNGLVHLAEVESLFGRTLQVVSQLKPATF